MDQEVARGDIGSDTGCEYYPCHYHGLNCSLCYCPFYPCGDEELGELIESRKGGKIWSCSNCYWIHRGSVVRETIDLIRDSSERPSHQEMLAIKEMLEMKYPKRGRSLMVLGATSGAGKSLIVTAICRILSNMGYEVSPFKSQNMSLNSMVTPRGEEIARIQVLQAMAARKEPNAHMNPILIKPKGERGSQLVVEGHPYRDIGVEEYYRDFTTGEGLEIIGRNYDFLARSNDIVVAEGAGSPAEINIYDVEIANMKTAEIMEASCLLVVNIEWGGAFAHIYGTLELLTPEHRSMFKGIIINNMRGHADLLGDGIERIERLTGVPVLGVVPHVELYLPDEDSMGLSSKRKEGSEINIGVVRLPQISNYTDFDPLTLESDVSVIYMERPEDLRGMDAVIIPGSKNSVSDLAWLIDTGFFTAIKKLQGRVPILGICGGFQMMGARILDPQSLEGDLGPEIHGLGLLDCVTRFDAYDKRTVQVKGVLVAGMGGEVKGYEIHMGKTEIGKCLPLFHIHQPDGPRPEGAISEDGMCMGTYLHGLFDLPPFRRFFLERISRTMRRESLDHDIIVEESLEKLANTVAENIDLGLLLDSLGLSFRSGGGTVGTASARAP